MNPNSAVPVRDRPIKGATAGSRPKLLGLVTTKNDEWIIGKCLQRLAECTDGIIVVDDGSTDATYEIVSSCPAVKHIIRNPEGRQWNVFADARRMMEVVRSFDPEWLMYVDSDDIVDVRFRELRDELLDRPAVARYHFREITLWRSNRFYRADHPEDWSRNCHRTPYLVRMSPTVYLGDHVTTRRHAFIRWAGRQWVTAYLRRRLPPQTLFRAHYGWRGALSSILWPRDLMNYTNLRVWGYSGTEVELPLVKLHYHFSNWEMAWRKHMIYALQAALQQIRAPGEIPMIVNWATARLSEEGLELNPVEEAWGPL